ncbi:CGNR zinc finger domain-containing protein [Streptosporangium sp. NPDC051023]|uniref:CGNR zinc finger domain-containing protein n=1 Tax=Streptosporangium sp. NPDC051023 TaxID=3155410 RepID=UPI00344EA358
MLVLEFVNTVHARRGRPGDDLSDVEGMTAWGLAHAAELGLGPSFAASEELRHEVVRLRQAVRALFARAVAPGPASGADVTRLPGFTESLALVNATALAAPVAPRLEWPREGAPVATRVLTGESGESARVRAVLATAAIEFLAGPYGEQLRTCGSSPCVLYFVKERPRQEWCSVRCGNRARAARHYHQHKAH